MIKTGSVKSKKNLRDSAKYRKWREMYNLQNAFTVMHNALYFNLFIILLTDAPFAIWLAQKTPFSTSIQTYQKTRNHQGKDVFVFGLLGIERFTWLPKYWAHSRLWISLNYSNEAQIFNWIRQIKLAWKALRWKAYLYFNQSDLFKFFLFFLAHCLVRLD